MRFIKWAEQTFTSGGRETEVLPLLERCTRELREAIRERSARPAVPRVTKVKYADATSASSRTRTSSSSWRRTISGRTAVLRGGRAAFLEMALSGESRRDCPWRSRDAWRIRDRQVQLAQFQHRMMRREQRAENAQNGVEDDTGELAETAARRFRDRRGGAERSAEGGHPGAAAAPASSGRRRGNRRRKSGRRGRLEARRARHAPVAAAAPPPPPRLRRAPTTCRRRWRPRATATTSAQRARARKRGPTAS